MPNLNPPPRRVLTPIMLFATTALVAFVLVVAALVIWLAEIVGSGAIAALMVGGLFLVVSLLIYLISVRRAMEYLHDKVETIYDVAFTARQGYRRIVRIFSSFCGDFFSH